MKAIVPSLLTVSGAAWGLCVTKSESGFFLRMKERSASNMVSGYRWALSSVVTAACAASLVAVFDVGHDYSFAVMDCLRRADLLRDEVPDAPKVFRDELVAGSYSHRS
jgi:hypothetical protein